MRVPLTKYGWPEAVVFPAVVLVIMVILLLGGTSILSVRAVVLIESFLAVVFIWLLAFFRDPYRCSPTDKSVLLAPADGRITNIETVQEDSFIGETALRLGIFLSIFDVHINRSPCNAKVERITYRKGKYKNAKNPSSGRINESNDVWLVRTDSPMEKILVRQISGAIARRIVCRISNGQKLSSGEKFGMIKFGSRTELYVPANEPSCVVRDASCEENTQCAIRNTQYKIKCLVRIGDKVKAGLTPLIRYEQCAD